MVLKYSFELFLLKLYLWIHDKYSSIRFKQCEWQRKILQKEVAVVVTWPSGQKPHFFHWRQLGCRLKSRRGYLHFVFFHRFFYPLAFYCLVSLLTLLASRDFCENVFLVYVFWWGHGPGPYKWSMDPVQNGGSMDSCFLLCPHFLGVKGFNLNS